MEELRSDNVDPLVIQQRNQVEQLKSELKCKKMLFSKNCMKLSDVVGQGSSGLVYRGYLDSGDNRDIVAIKTCKGI
jgi:hypothetical protein